MLESGILAASSVDFSSSSRVEREPSGASEEEDGHPGTGISNQWEEVPSLASSFPSLPSVSSHEKQPTTEDHHHHHHEHHASEHEHHHRHQHQQQLPAPPSLTVSIFSSALSPRARVLAIFSSLAINMFLPFVNGVMLGFGEIFAQNIVAPLLGWKPPGALGIRAARGGAVPGDGRKQTRR